MEDGDKVTATVQKPRTLELRHSNNIMIDKTVLIQPPVDVAMNNDSDISAVSSMIVCSSLSDSTITSAEACDTNVMTKSEQDLLNGNDLRVTEMVESNDASSSSNEFAMDNEYKAAMMPQDKTLTDDNSRSASDEIELPCAMFGQMIANEDETWELLSDAASWEFSFPTDILNEYDETCSSPKAYRDVSDHLPPGWKELSDSTGSYFWNTDTGLMQSEHPSHNSEDSKDDMSSAKSSDTIKPADEASSHVKSNIQRWSGNSRDGHLFLVRSLGWLPIEHDNLKPDVSSASVNSCIRLLSNNRSQIMDGVGVWGEGKDLMLLLNENHLKIVDPLENTVLQSQSIKHIRVWGVGRDSAHDFAYVVRDPTTRIYKCHVFRCDAPAQSIAKQLHTICSLLVKQKKISNRKGQQDANALNANNTDEIPVPTVESCQTFQSKYMGEIKVSKPSGINILKQAIHELMRDFEGVGKGVKVSVSPSALTVTDDAGDTIVNCRMRCLSFMGVGEDIQLFGFINVVGGEAICHVMQCEPNAAKLALAVQEACMLRYQKAIDSKQPIKNSNEPQRSKSLKTKVMRLFSGWKNNR